MTESGTTGSPTGVGYGVAVPTLFAVMHIELPHRHERFGAVRIHELTQVIELDSGRDESPSAKVIDSTDGSRRVGNVPNSAMLEVEERMAIVVPVKNERRKVLDGVLSGIPGSCPLIMISASERTPIDRYLLETDLLSEFCSVTGRRAIALHQDDPGLAAALVAAGYETMVSEGRVRPGKGEAMVVGMLLAELDKCRSVGFVDADNYVPGAVHEYVKAFAAGLHLAPTPYAMVRISWQSKPKVSEGQLVFNRWGRSTRTINHFLNQVLSTYSGFGTEMIATGNAGEHALSMDLARRMRFAGGFAAEPFELVELFEQFGGAFPSPYPEVNESLVDVFQVETRNPHFHEDKGDGHVDGMRMAGLDALASSRVCPEPVAAAIEQFVGAELQRTARKDVPVYPPFAAMDVDAFGMALPASKTYMTWG